MERKGGEGESWKTRREEEDEREKRERKKNNFHMTR